MRTFTNRRLPPRTWRRQLQALVRRLRTQEPAGSEDGRMATFSVQQIVEYFVAHREIVACRVGTGEIRQIDAVWRWPNPLTIPLRAGAESRRDRQTMNTSEQPTSQLQSPCHIVSRLLLGKNNKL